MTEQEVQEAAVKALKNEWGKTFTLGSEDRGQTVQTFEIKDLPYYDYIEFVQLAKPLITAMASGVNMTAKDGELGADFSLDSLDIDALIRLCGKELPRMGFLICRQSQPKIKEVDVAMLAHRPQRLLEVVLLQIMHNRMIDEFASFFTRLTAMVSTLIPSAAQVAGTVPMELTTEETPSSS